METTLKEEIEKTVNCLADISVEIKGYVSDDVKKAAEVQNVELKKIYILEDFRKQAYNAYCGISFSPGKRAESVVVDYSEQLEDDLSKMPESERERYVQNYRKHLSAWLGAMSRCLSSMITGPANFPVRRNQKANDVEHKRSVEFTEWRERALRAIEKQRLANRSENEVGDEIWNRMKKGIASSAATILQIDLGESFYTRALFVNSITGTIKTWAKNGRVDLVKKGLAYVKELNEWAKEKGGKDIIAAKNGIWELEQAAEVAREEKVDAAVRENETQEFTFPNTLGTIEIIKNYKIDRIQIMFPGKPSEEIRGILKGSGAAFKWAPSEGAWQRQLTRNAEYAVEQLIKKFSQIETDEVGRIAVHG